MEKKIFEEACTLLKSADAVAMITAASLPEIETFDWYEGQPEDSIKEEENKADAFDMPALFFEFGPTVYAPKTNNIHQEANGTLILHLCQDKMGKSGRDGNETQSDFKALLNYANKIVDILTSEKLNCSAQLVLSQVLRDHTNSPMMHERITFTWNGKRKRISVPVVVVP